MADAKVREFLRQRFYNHPSGNDRVELLYLPIFNWLTDLKRKHSTKAPLFVGINGPQGAGKSTLTAALVEAFELIGQKALTLSIDDFYLTHDEQKNLAQKFSHNSFLKQRGYPGTHDIKLGEKTLKAVNEIKRNQEVDVPTYDKSKYSGQGDRNPSSLWMKINHPQDIIFLEGWMLGFTQVPVESYSTLSNRNDFSEINKFLPAYESWMKFLNCFVYLKPDNYKNVLSWRVEAEENMKASGKLGMSKTEITAYIEKFLPAYEIYGDRLNAQSTGIKEFLQIKIGKNRLPT